MDRLLFLVRRGVMTLALLAITLQVLLPASMLHARMSDGAPGHVAICRADGALDQAPVDQVPGSEPGATCPLCAAPTAGQITLPGTPAVASPRLLATPIDWSVVVRSAGPATPPAAWPDSRAPPAAA